MSSAASNTKVGCEADWLRTCGTLLDLMGWRWLHHRPARRANGLWGTPTMGNAAKGFPDLFCVHPKTERALAIELKVYGNRATPEQREWITALNTAGIESYVLTMPEDWPTFEDLVRLGPEQQTLFTANSTAATYRQGRP